MVAEPREDVDHESGSVLHSELGVHALKMRAHGGNRDR